MSIIKRAMQQLDMGGRGWRVPVMVGAGVAAAGLALWSLNRIRQGRLPLKWEEVGTVEALIMYPVKSGGGYTVPWGLVTSYGLEVDSVVDRSFVVMLMEAAKPTHVTNGMAPMLCTIIPTVKNNVLTLTPLQGDPMHVDIKRPLKGEPAKFIVKGDPVSGWDMGDEVAQWLSELLYRDSESKPKVRLMYVGSKPEELGRPAKKPAIFQFPQFKKDDSIIYHDAAAFLLTTTSSLDDLNGRLSSPVTMRQLRPNIVVKGRPAWEEDEWAYVRIGDAVQLRTLKPRDACIRVNVDPTSGKRQPEVLDTLKKFRVLPMPEVLHKAWSQKPLFGLHMAMDVRGKISVGDKVFAVRRKPDWLL